MAAAEIRVQVVYCPQARVEDLTDLELREGSTVAEALRASGVLARHPELGAEPRVGVWSREQPLSQPLRDHDRVEIYRPLTVDPKEARRLRYKRQKDASSGNRAK